jgi:NAD(P)H-nitrite reductase large subunit
MRHVLVGAGPASLNALETLRSLDPAAEITLICDEPPYSRMVLPYLLAGSIEEQAVRTGDAAWFEGLGVATRFGSRVVALDPEADRVLLDDGSALPFDRLLLATGSRAVRPSIPGAEHPSVLTLWTLDDARAFLSRSHGDVIIVGAGFIAFTILDAIAARAERVRFVEQEPRILPHMLDEAAASMMQAQLVSRGIEVHTGTRLDGIDAGGSRPRLSFASGQSLESDAVILAVGVLPNADFLEGAGVDVDHGILVDDHLRTSRARVFAAGDVAQGPELQTGERRVHAIQPTAVDHGRVAAVNMAGEDVAYSGTLTMNILAAQGLETCSFGLWRGEEDVTRVSNAVDHIYRKYVWDGDRLAGGILLGPTLAVSGVNDAGMLKGLIQSGVSLGPWRSYLEENPLDLRRAYVASGAARELLGSGLLTGRASSGGGFRFPPLPASRPRSRHHELLVRGSS